MGGTIIVDTRQHRGKHAVKDAWWASHGVSTVRQTLDFGDYMAEGSNVSVDTKRNIDEIAQNIGGRNHKRFKNECVRARDASCRLVILVETYEGVHQVADLVSWTNGHCRMCRMCNPHAKGKCDKHGTNKPIQGARLMTAMNTMAFRYGVRFEFCRPKEAAQRICELLGVEYEQDAEGR
ncbi:MAG: ERCC4 domain-containing protein [Eggerthellaceae bacterium]|nr:ERCC4 domain-containing protein [Eggerthellaceae bacterium]